jgi:hypothetical protein
MAKREEQHPFLWKPAGRMVICLGPTLSVIECQTFLQDLGESA